MTQSTDPDRQFIQSAKRSLRFLNWNNFWGILAAVPVGGIVLATVAICAIAVGHPFICAFAVGAGVYSSYRTIKYFGRLNSGMVERQFDLAENVKDYLDKSGDLHPIVSQNKHWQQEVTASRTDRTLSKD
jgi:hypothetical protein